jgi:poly(hydroxyalkanoate) depolymerase family esterase
MARRRTRSSPWASLIGRAVGQAAGASLRVGRKVVRNAARQVAEHAKPPPGAGDWVTGVAMGPAGLRRYRLFQPPALQPGERLPLMLMLHGCGQDAKSFAVSTGMNRIAARERFFVLYPEQDRLANPQGCWNWYDTRSGRAHGEAALLLAAVDQATLLHRIDRERVAVAGLSAGASMAALLASRFPERFRAVVMHSGVPPGSASTTVGALGAMRGHRLPAALPGRLASGTLPPLMVIQGGRDAVVASANGLAAAQLWAEAAGARAGSGRQVQRGKRHAMTVTDFKYKGRTMATLCEVGALGHAWSGGAARQPFSDALGPDASRMAWAFAAKQFSRLTKE